MKGGSKKVKFQRIENDEIFLSYEDGNFCGRSPVLWKTGEAEREDIIRPFLSMARSLTTSQKTYPRNETKE